MNWLELNSVFDEEKFRSLAGLPNLQTGEVQLNNEHKINWRQRSRVISATDSPQSMGPGFDSRSDHYLDLFHAAPSLSCQPHFVNSWFASASRFNELYFSVVYSAPLALVLLTLPESK